MWTLIIIQYLMIQSSTSMDPAIEDEEIRAANFLIYLNRKIPELKTKEAVAKWNYETNITEETSKAKLRTVEETGKEYKKYWEEIMKFRLQEFQNYDIKRQLLFYSYLGDAALPDNKYKKFLKITNDMLKVYSTAKLCDFKDSEKCDLSLEPELTEIMLNSRDPDELKYVWVKWREAIGARVKSLYKDYVLYKNEAARLNNFPNAGEAWLRSFETKDIKEQVKVLWEQIRPLYLQIHAYVRFKLREKYGDIVSEKGPIPAHLLGNMWAQTWRTVAEFSYPYPNKTFIDVSEEMVQQNYTPKTIFKLAEEFFTSINLSEMPETFWEKSIFEKPDDGRQLVCQAQAWDFFDKKDFRMRQCTRITYESFKAAHHEMGNIQYYLQYKDQPYPYRRAANDAFHEAVGDIIALSVSTMKHLRKIGLLKSKETDNEIILNNLYKLGLEKVMFLPFAYVMELWRWDVFSGNTKPEDYNCKWWKLRHEYQGIEPPVDRTENDFDPAAKFHIIADVTYIKYFISYIIQFQFHRTLCEKAGQYIPHNPRKPLYECDIFQSLEAGYALKKILEMGSSRPWQDAMESLTGQRFMHAGALLEYFEPLRTWLEEENKKNNVFIGWESPTHSCGEADKADTIE